MTTDDEFTLLESMHLGIKLAERRDWTGMSVLLRKAIAEIEMLRSRLDRTVRMDLSEEFVWPPNVKETQ